MEQIEKWEYLVQSLSGTFSSPKDEDIESALNEWGEDGWEVLAVIQHSGTNRIRVVAKRPLSDRARRQHSMPG